MKKLLTLLGVLGMSVAAWAQTLNSPDGNLKLTFRTVGRENPCLFAGI